MAGGSRRGARRRSRGFTEARVSRRPRVDPGVGRAGRPGDVLGQTSSAASGCSRPSGEPESDASEFLHLAAMAAATAFALEEARERDQVEHRRAACWRDSPTAAPRPSEALRAARERGFDPAGGLVVLVTDATARPHEAVALIESEARRRAGRGRRRPRVRAGAGRAAAGRRARGAPSRGWRRGCAPTARPARRPATRGADELRRAVREAELVLDGAGRRLRGRA